MPDWVRVVVPDWVRVVVLDWVRVVCQTGWGMVVPDWVRDGCTTTYSLTIKSSGIELFFNMYICLSIAFPFIKFALQVVGLLGSFVFHFLW